MCVCVSQHLCGLLQRDNEEYQRQDKMKNMAVVKYKMAKAQYLPT